ncbi:MAG: hypothetical protein NTX89_04740 [Candidatus Omnitrophica bacterium]|nr:hypothetical protein [Candidatus Omnitrophota bacterium]
MADICLKEERILLKKEVAVRVFKPGIIIAIITGGFFMIVLPLKVYAQPSIDINKNPVVIMDKQIVEVDRRILKSAQGLGAQGAIKSARQKLQQDIRKMKADKMALKNSQKRR